MKKRYGFFLFVLLLTGLLASTLCVWAEPLSTSSSSGRASGISDGTAYTIHCAAAPFKVVDIAGGSSASRANVQLYSSNGSGAQKFYFNYDQKTGTYFIKNAKTGKVLDVKGSSKNKGANVWQYNQNNTAAQRWKVSRNSDGTYTIKNSMTGYVLDVSGGLPADRQNIQVWSSNGSSAQKWYINTDTTKNHYSGGYTLSDNATITDDVAGDGVMDTFGYSYTKSSFAITSLTIRINGISHTTHLKGDYCGSIDSFFITDLNIHDAYKNIIVTYLTDDDDPVSDIYYFIDKKFGYAGEYDGSLHRDLVSGTGNFGLLVRAHFSVSGLGRYTTKEMRSIWNGTCKLKSGTAGHVSGSMSFSSSGFVKGFNVKASGSISCYTDIACTKKAATIPSGGAFGIIALGEDANKIDHLKISYNSRSYWLKWSANKNIAGYSAAA